MKRDLPIAMAAGVLGALLMVAALRGSVLGVLLGLMFSSMPLAMSALGLGLPYMPLAVVSGAVAVAALTGSAVLVALYVALDAVPIAIVMRVVARHGANAISGPALGRTAAMLVVAAAALMAAALAGVPAEPDGIEATLRARLDALVSEVPTTPGSAALTPGMVSAALAPVLPGAAASNWALRALIGATLGQWLLARDGFARWPTPAYRTVAVPGWFIGVFWLVTVAGWQAPGDAGYVAANAAIVLSLPLVLQGLAVVHAATAKFGFGRMGLVAFYGMALLGGGAALVLVVIVGVMEHFLQLRTRLARGSRNGG